MKPSAENGMRAALTAALSVQPAPVQVGWKTIDSAPKDGTTIEVKYISDDPRRVRWSTSDRGTWWHLTDVHRAAVIKFDPTHWRPLFEPPGAAAPSPAPSVEQMREALEALKPFKDYADQAGHAWPDDTPTAFQTSRLTLGDCRRARTAYEALSLVPQPAGKK